MVQGVGSRNPGEIVSLVRLIRKSGHALNADLLKHGLRLRWLDEPDQDFTLGDLLDFVEYATPDMAIAKLEYEDHEWNLTNQLVASVLDRLNMDAWSQGGGKGQKPKPIPRPGVTDKSTKKYTTSKVSTVTEIDEWLARKRGA